MCARYAPSVLPRRISGREPHVQRQGESPAIERGTEPKPVAAIASTQVFQDGLARGSGRRVAVVDGEELRPDLRRAAAELRSKIALELGHLPSDNRGLLSTLPLLALPA